MTKSAIAAALAAAIAMGTYSGYIVQPAQAATAVAPASSLQPDQVRASKLIGSSVYDVQNQDIGSVKDVILDRDGRVAAVVLDVGSFLGVGGKYVAVSLNDFKTDNNRLTLNRSKDQLKTARSYVLEPTNESTTNRAAH